MKYSIVEFGDKTIGIQGIEGEYSVMACCLSDREKIEYIVSWLNAQKKPIEDFRDWFLGDTANGMKALGEPYDL